MVFDKCFDGRCSICLQNHSPMTLCKQETLIQIIERMRANAKAMQKLNTELLDAARSFQAIIRQCVPRIEAMLVLGNRLSDVIQMFIGYTTPEDCPTPHKMGVEIRDEWLKLSGEYEDGTKDVPTQTQEN